MPDGRELRARVQRRNAGLRRLKLLTGAVVVATAALAGIFAGFAADTSAARKVVRVRVQTAAPPRRAVAALRPARIPPPPQLPPVRPVATPATAPEATPPPPPPPPPPPVQPPAPTPVPPVVVSGGS